MDLFARLQYLYVDGGLEHVHPIYAVIHEENSKELLVLKPVIAEHTVKDALRFSPKFLADGNTTSSGKNFTKPSLILYQILKATQQVLRMRSQSLLLTYHSIIW